MRRRRHKRQPLLARRRGNSVSELPLAVVVLPQPRRRRGVVDRAAARRAAALLPDEESGGAEQERRRWHDSFDDATGAVHDLERGRQLRREQVDLAYEMSMMERRRVQARNAVVLDKRASRADLAEFEARVHALVRRNNPETKPKALQFDSLVLDQAGRTAKLNGQTIVLTPREYSILEALMADEGKAVSREHLGELVALGEEDLTNNLFQVNISRLRKKLEGTGVSIRQIRGFGYMLQTNRAAAEQG